MRFFLVVFAVLLVVAVGSIFTHMIFIKRDRLAFIDREIVSTAKAMVASKITELEKIDPTEGRHIISETLKEDRIGKIFIIRDQQNNVIFQKGASGSLGVPDIPTSPEWYQAHIHGKYVRVLNVSLPKFPYRTLQVGMVLSEDLVAEPFFSRSSSIYLIVILGLGFAASLFLTSFLLRPIAQIEEFLISVSNQIQMRPRISSLPSSLLPATTVVSKDEFKRMLVCLNSLIDKFNRSFQYSRLWAYQMAHELKTPLAILNLEIEKLESQRSLTLQDVSALTTESGKLNDTITSFLGWAALENSVQNVHLYSNRASVVAEAVCRRFDRLSPQRIELEVGSDPLVKALPQHFEQLISNLVANALSYSEASTQVRVKISDNAISVADRGLGIPAEVLERLGEPFNRGGFVRGCVPGSGLGLAWVKSICDLYAWTIEFKSTAQGSEVNIQFGQNLK